MHKLNEVTYIPGEANILANALSRLTKHLRVEGRELENIKPRVQKKLYESSANGWIYMEDA